MKTPAVKVLFAAVAAVVLAAGAECAETAHPLNAYVTDGLIGWWDGEYNSLVDGVPVHKSDTTQWQALRGGGVFGPTNTLVFGEKSVTLAGNRLISAVAGMPTDGATPVTVQIVARCVATANPDQSHQLFSTWHGDWGLTKDTKTLTGGARDNAGRFMTYNVAFTNDLAQLQMDSFVFNDGDFAFIANLADATTTKSGSPWGTQKPSEIFTIGSTRAAGFFTYEYFSIRVYNRMLSPGEMIRNIAVDKDRFGLNVDIPVVTPIPMPSGAVTADSYVQDHLYAQWDGVYNRLVDGKPTHVENPTQWDDLKGKANPFQDEARLTFKSNRVSVAASSASIKNDNALPWLKGGYHTWTMEISAYCSKKALNEKNAMDVVLYSPYGGLAYFAHSSHVTGSAAALDGTVRYRFEINGPEVAGLEPHTYSLVFDDTFGQLAYDGQRVVITKGSRKDPVNLGETHLALGSSRQSDFDFHSIRIYDRPLTFEEQQWNAAVDAVRFGDLKANLVIAGDSRCVGTVSPEYGSYCGLTENMVVQCSAETATSPRKFLGYEVQTNGVNGTWHPWLSGTNSCFYLVMPKAQTKVIWKWKSPGFMLMVF